MLPCGLVLLTRKLINAAREPEVHDLAELLNKMGARVRGAGTPTIQIEGVTELGDAEHTIIPDRIETGTFIVAAAITKGELEIRDCNPEHCNRVIAKLREVGVEIEEINQSTLHVRCGARGLKAGDLITEPYPRFPTDMPALARSNISLVNCSNRSSRHPTSFRFRIAARVLRLRT